MMRSKVLLGLLTTAAISACTPSGNTGTTDGGTAADGGQTGNDPCGTAPDGANNVCQLQNPDSPNQVSANTETMLKGVVVTSPVFEVSSSMTTGKTLNGFFVADAADAAAWNGVLVTVDAALNVDLSGVAIGKTVDVTGAPDEFSLNAAGSETQFKATAVTVAGDGDTPTAIVVDPATLADQTAGEPYEGVLVKVEAVSVESIGQFGEFTVTGGLVVSNKLRHGHNPVVGQVLTSLTGVMSYAAFEGNEGFRLTPRSGDDILAEDLNFDAYTLPQLLDSAADGHVMPCAQGSDCAPVRVESMVVTSETTVIARDRDTRKPYLFGFFVADPTAVDGDGRSLPYSGIQVTIAPGSNSVGTNDYTFGVDAMGEYPNPDDVDYAGFPRPGDVVNVVGQSSSYYDQPQLRDVIALEAVTDATVMAPMPAQFDGMADEASDRHPARLQGGRPAVAAAPLMREGLPADPAARSWLGVPVELINVTTTEACIGYPNANTNPTHFRDRGNWIVTGGVEIGTLFTNTFGGYWLNVPYDSDERTCDNAGTVDNNAATKKCRDSRAVGQAFTSIKGIPNISFNVQRLNPTSDTDVGPDTLYAPEGAGDCVDMTP